MNELEKLLEHFNNDKKIVAKLLDVKVRYIDMILDGKKEPGRHLRKLMRIYLLMYEG